MDDHDDDDFFSLGCGFPLLSAEREARASILGVALKRESI